MQDVSVKPDNALTGEIETGKKFKGISGFFRYNIFVILAFLIPFVLMVAAFAIKKVSPFGDQQILVTDLWHQYYPFLVDFQDKLKNGESLFWSWTQGGGVNYFALMSYYLAGPMNFLSVFIPSDWLREFLMFSVAAKIAFAGCFTAIFLRSIFKKNDFSIVVFGCSFSFCAFFMGYYWNTIWLDTVCITPLVVLGAVKLLSEGKFRLYTITLALALISNYYIGFFICIFVLLVFVAYSIVKWTNSKQFFKNLMRMALYSVIAIGITAFFLLPAFMALQNTYATTKTFPTTFAINIGGSNDLIGVLNAFKQILSNFITFTEPNVKDAYDLPNVACGTVSLVLGILFVTSPKIKIREKIFDICLIVFMILSCIIRQLDYIWHGFHFTNMIPYRFSFLISFVLVVMAFRAFMLIDFSSYWDVILAALFSAVIILLAIGTQEIYAIVGTAVIAALLCAVMFLFTKRIVPKQVLLIVISIAVIGESAVTAYVGVDVTKVTSTTYYPKGLKTTEQLIDKMNEREEKTTEMWRAETVATQTLNDGSLNLYNGLSMFNSMANVNMTEFFENFGMMGWKSGNRYTYAESSPITNTFMNLKYIIGRDGYCNNSYDLEEVEEIGGEKLFLNTDYIPMGFMVNDDLLKWEINENEDQFNPFDTQNDFFKKATGVEEDVYTPVQVIHQGHTVYEEFPVNKTSYGNYTYGASTTSEKPHLKWNYEAPEDGYYCFYAHITNGNTVTIMINEESQPHTYNMQRGYIACIGYVNKGDLISVYSEVEAEKSGTAQVYVNRFNNEVFEKGYERISKDYMETTSLTESSMEGTINVSQDGLFYTSIPYEDGWVAYVDGKKKEITPVGDALIAFELNEGPHDIKLYYYPKGFWPGFIVTLISVAAFVMTCLYAYVYKKKKQPVEEIPVKAKKSVKTKKNKKRKKR